MAFQKWLVLPVSELHHIAMLIDIHVHTLVSKCSRLPLQDILSHARSLGLDGVCITDHDSHAADTQVREGYQSDGLLVLIGMEYTTVQGDYLVFGPVEKLEPGMSLAELSATVDRLGGVLVSAHPCRVAKPADLRVYRAGLCRVIEVANGGNTEFENAQAMSIADRQGLIPVSGSDAHCLDELGVLPTRFKVPIANRKDLVNALKQGQCIPRTSPRKVA